jgi:voltage-gated potassium channel
MSTQADRKYWGNEAAYHVLLALLLVQMALYPFGRGMISRLTFAAIFFACIWAVASQRRLLVVALLLGVPTLALGLIANASAAAAGLVLGMAMLGFICVVFLSRVFAHPVVTRGTVSASLVVYLLLGVIWYQAYQLVEQILPGSFYGVAASDGVATAGELFYYSFVTLSTLGYGDMGPVSDYARSLAITEAVVGQLYLVVLVATLVGMYLSDRGQSSPE